MERKINRLDKYISFKGLNDNKVTVECGLSNGLLGNARRGSADLGDKTIEKILKKYGDLNRVWLITGEGEMLNKTASTTGLHSPIVTGDGNVFTSTGNGSDCAALLAEKDALIAHLKEENKNLWDLIKSKQNP